MERETVERNKERVCGGGRCDESGLEGWSRGFGGLRTREREMKRKKERVIVWGWAVIFEISPITRHKARTPSTGPSHITLGPQHVTRSWRVSIKQATGLGH